MTIPTTNSVEDNNISTPMTNSTQVVQPPHPFQVRNLTEIVISLEILDGEVVVMVGSHDVKWDARKVWSGKRFLSQTSYSQIALAENLEKRLFG